MRGELRFEDVSFRYGAEPTAPWALRDIDLTIAARPDGGAGRRDGRRQVDLRQARGPLLRPDRRARCWSTATTCARSPRTRCARRWGSSPRRASCSAARCARTSPSGDPSASDEEIRDGARAVGADDFIARARARLRHGGRRARRAALGRPAPAARLRPGARRRPADPGARRGDLQRRRPHREPDRGGAAAAGRRPDRDRDRPPPVDDPPRRRGSSSWSTGEIVEQGTHEELLDAGGRYWELYRDWAEQAAA